MQNVGTVTMPNITPPRRRSPNPWLSSFFAGVGNTIGDLFIRREKQKSQETHFSLFALARATLESDDRAIVGKIYTVETGISQNSQAGFSGGTFELSVNNPSEYLLFDIILHASDNIQLRNWYGHLRYNPRNPQLQFTSFTFHLTAPGHSFLIINFYRERQWLKTIRLEFEGIEQATFARAYNQWS